jgi:hypothetical protein
MAVEDLDLLLEIAEKNAVDVEWEQGDLVILDVSIPRQSFEQTLTVLQNYAVQHSRKPWKGERQVLAALWDDNGRVSDFPEGERLLARAPRRPMLAHDAA